MADTLNDGGPAFPCPAYLDQLPAYSNGPQGGMSLRDYFAAQAMVFFSNRDTQRAANEDAHVRSRTPADEIATTCYEIADAMLKAREPK